MREHYTKQCLLGTYIKEHEVFRLRHFALCCVALYVWYDLASWATPVAQLVEHLPRTHNECRGFESRSLRQLINGCLAMCCVVLLYGSHGLKISCMWVSGNLLVYVHALCTQMYISIADVSTTQSRSNILFWLANLCDNNTVHVCLFYSKTFTGVLMCQGS